MPPEHGTLVLGDEPDGDRAIEYVPYAGARPTEGVSVRHAPPTHASPHWRTTPSGGPTTPLATPPLATVPYPWRAFPQPISPSRLPWVPSGGGVSAMAVAVKDASAESVQSATAVILLDPSVPDALDRIRETVRDAMPFYTLPLVTAPAAAVETERLQALRGVISVRLFSKGLGQMGAVLEGLDALSATDLRAVDVDRGPLLGGLDEGGGYPVLDVGSTRRIRLDPEASHYTHPAMMPVINVSLGPAHPFAPLRPDDPVNHATARIAERQLLVVSAGNTGRADDVETMSAWAEVPWVLAVGASDDRNGARLASYSSTGIPGDPTSGPDLVAWGASASDESRVGTSFAAPRLSKYALSAAAALLQIRSAIQRLRRRAVEGVPLVGLGLIDLFGDDRFPGRARLPVGALPFVPINDDALRETVDTLDRSSVRLDVSVAPTRLREMLIAAARPMAAYGPHEVGAGFVGDEPWADWLSNMSGAHLARLCAVDPVASSALERLRQPIFTAEAVKTLMDLVQATYPVWRWDWRLREMGIRPVEEG